MRTGCRDLGGRGEIPDKSQHSSHDNAYQFETMVEGVADYEQMTISGQRSFSNEKLVIKMKV